MYSGVRNALSGHALSPAGHGRRRRPRRVVGRHLCDSTVRLWPACKLRPSTVYIGRSDLTYVMRMATVTKPPIFTPATRCFCVPPRLTCLHTMNLRVPVHPPSRPSRPPLRSTACSSPVPFAHVLACPPRAPVSESAQRRSSNGRTHGGYCSPCARVRGARLRCSHYHVAKPGGHFAIRKYDGRDHVIRKVSRAARLSSGPDGHMLWTLERRSWNSASLSVV